MISGPKTASKVDITQIQSLLNNLKTSTAVTSASNCSSATGIKLHSQNSQGSTNSAPMNGGVSSFNSQINPHTYSRSTSRGKETQANKLSAMLGRPTGFNQSFSTRNTANPINTGNNSATNINQMYKAQAPNFYPRPSTIRQKQGSDPRDLPVATVV